MRGILRAARENVEAGEIAQGGSTITQQYVKLTLLDPTQTVNRKAREAVLAWRLEQTYSKEEILERYLNAIYLGRGAYGVGTAAQEYFGKPVGQLSAAEGALIAGMIRAPSATDPYAEPAPVLARRNVVLQRMAELGYLAPDALAAAIAEPLQLAPPRPDTERYPAGHFVEAVKQWILGDPRFGAADEDRRNLLFRGGLRITTTLDPTLQAAAEQAVSGTLPGDGAHPDGALVTIEPSTGKVKAMVGGRDYFGPSPYAKVNLAMGDGRQAGSTFKPFVLAAALADGIPLTRTYGAPAELEIPLGDGVAPWKVQNYGGARAGNVSLTEATVWSYNTAYARLMMDLGPAKAVDMAGRLGVRTTLQAVPAAVLGTENVTVLDMADAYATFANRGVHVTPSLVTSITRADGSVLYQAAPETAPALDPAVADQVTWVLRQVIGRGTGTAAGLGRAAAGKTGTAEGYRDAWFVGYTPDLATAVWVGYAEGQTPMVPPTTPIAVTGGSWPAQIWQPVHGAGRSATPRPGLHRARRRDPAAHRGVAPAHHGVGSARPRRCRRGRYARRSALRQHHHLVSRLVRRGGRRSERRARRARAALRSSPEWPGRRVRDADRLGALGTVRVSGPERAGGHHDHERRPIQRRAPVDHNRRPRPPQEVQPARAARAARRRPGEAPGRAPGERAMTARSAPSPRAGSRGAAGRDRGRAPAGEATVVAPARGAAPGGGSSCRRSSSGSTRSRGWPSAIRPTRCSTATSPSGPSLAAPRPPRRSTSCHPRTPPGTRSSGPTPSTPAPSCCARWSPTCAPWHLPTGPTGRWCWRGSTTGTPTWPTATTTPAGCGPTLGPASSSTSATGRRSPCRWTTWRTSTAWRPA